MKYCDARDIILQDLSAVRHSVSESDFKEYIETSKVFTERPSLQDFVRGLSKKELYDACNMAQERLNEAFDESIESEEKILSSVLTDNDALFSNNYVRIFVQDGNAYTFSSSSLGCIKRLLFIGAELASDISCEYVYKELYESENGYTYCFLDTDYNEHSFSFEKMELVTEYCNATPRAGGGIWLQMFSSCTTICEKVKNGKANEKERRIYPLLASVVKLYSEYLYASITQPELDAMKAFLSELGLTKAQSLFEKASELIAQPSVSDRKKTRATNAFISQLEKSEKAFRALYGVIADSQSGIPYDTDICATDDTRLERQMITSEMASLGYTGEYPIFMKKTEINGVHLVGEGNLIQSHLVASQKHVFCFVYAVETLIEDGTVDIQLHSATAVISKKDALSGFVPDGFTPLFSKPGKHFSIANAFRDGTDIKTKTHIAAKRAELRPLDRKDKASVITTPTGCVVAFAAVGGLIFSISYTAITVLALSSLYDFGKVNISVLFFGVFLAFTACLCAIMLTNNRR